VAAAALPIALAAGPVSAASGISVSTSGSTVSVTTSACGRINGSWGTASLLDSRQTSFAHGRQVALSGTAAAQSAAWSSVTPGTYTVIVLCSNNDTAGTQTVIVAPAPSPSPTRSAVPAATASPSRGVLGGVGGAVRDYGTVTLVAGGALAGSGVIAAVWFLRRRAKPYRF
jgi:surface antigen